MEKDNKSEAAARLRERAEALLNEKLSKTAEQPSETEIKKSVKSVLPLSETETLKLIHELEVHQIELELENEELRLAKEQAETLSEKFTELFDFAPAGYFTLSKGGKIIELNLSGAKMLGQERSRLVDSRFCLYVSKDTRQVFTDFLRKVFENNTKESCEIALSTDGNLPMHIYITCIAAENRKHCLMTVQDITERKQAEELLQQTRQNYETFFDTIDEFLYVLDEQGNIIHTNATVKNRLGYTKEEIIGKSVLEHHPQERREEAGRIVGEMLSGTAEFCPVPLITKAGVQIPVETIVSHGIWDGKPVIFGVTKDISKVRLSEEKFSKVFYLNPSACGLSDLDTGKYVEVNEAFYTLLGFNKGGFYKLTTI